MSIVLEKEIDIHMHEVQRITNEMNTMKLYTMKIKKVKDKERI